MGAISSLFENPQHSTDSLTLRKPDYQEQEYANKRQSQREDQHPNRFILKSESENSHDVPRSLTIFTIR